MPKIKDSEKELRTESITVRLTVKEKNRLLEAAKNVGLPITSFVRQKLVYCQADLIQQVLENYKKRG